MEYSREAVEGLLEFGASIGEVKAALKDEKGFEDEGGLAEIRAVRRLYREALGRRPKEVGQRSSVFSLFVISAM